MKSTVRWILLLPGALSAGYLAYLVGGTINRVSMAMLLGPLEGWYSLAAIFMEQMYLGASVLYVGGRIAPCHKRFTVFALSALMILFVGFSTALVLTQPSSVSLPDSISGSTGVIFAVGAVVVALEQGELDLGQDVA
ncbi:MAG: hypothetical protein WC124_00165 [Desulfoplanes sp.]